MRRVATATEWILGLLKLTESIVMTVGYARPNVADMVIRVFERSVHPELFATVSETRVNVRGDVATLRLGRQGHSLEYRTEHGTLTEIATSKFAPLPSQLCMIDRRLIGYRTHTVEGKGVRYHSSYTGIRACRYLPDLAPRTGNRCPHIHTRRRPARFQHQQSGMSESTQVRPAPGRLRRPRLPYVPRQRCCAENSNPV